MAIDPVIDVRTQLGNRRGLGVGAFVLALVTVGALVHVAVRMKGIEVAYDLGRERRINTQLEEQRRRLNIEIGMLKDPVRVVSIARDKLHMGPPAPGDIVRLGPGGLLTPVVQETAPAQASRPKPRATHPAARPAPAPRAAATALKNAPAGPREEADDVTPGEAQ